MPTQHPWRKLVCRQWDLGVAAPDEEGTFSEQYALFPKELRSHVYLFLFFTVVVRLKPGLCVCQAGILLLGTPLAPVFLVEGNEGEREIWRTLDVRV